MKRAQSGFTLIELMIVVAIIAILAAIAIPAYNEYITETRIGKMVDHYDEGYRLVKSDLAKRISQAARGETVADFNATTFITGNLNPEGRLAPQGTVNAFAPNASPSATYGQVGIQVVTATAGEEVIVVHRPAYLGATAASIRITQQTM